MNSKAEIAKLLRVLAKAVDEMNELEYEQLVNGTGQLGLIETVPKKTKPRLSANSQITPEELQDIVGDLQDCKSREEARELLRKDQRITLKDNLEKIAKHLKVHVNKHDKREAVEDKIVEFVIGVKLRSEAILGLNLKSSGTSQDQS